MQEQLLHEAEQGRRPAGQQQQFAGVDLRRPKGYAAAPAATAVVASEGNPCPRCESRDTKFCYYNNYNTSQPRHFCKGCRRYWTKGGTLRNVPVGGGTRKKSSSSASPLAAKRHKSSEKCALVATAESDTSAADVVAAAPDSAKTAETTTTTTPADAASEITTELVVPAAEEDSFTDLLQHGDDALELELGFSGDYPATGLKRFGDHVSYEWPPAFDLGPYWSGSGAEFVDSDPAVFMNLP